MTTIPMRWERVTGIAPAKARAWWFDLREDDHGQPEYRKHSGKEKRRIVSRSPTEVRTEDTWGGWTFPAVVRQEGKDALTYRIGEGKYVQDATLRFQEVAGGTRMVWEGRVKVRGVFGLLAGLMKGKFQRESLEDMDLHTAHMEREWREKPW